MTETLLDAVFLGPMLKYPVQFSSGETFVSDDRNTAIRGRLIVGRRVVVVWAEAGQRIIESV